jgi:hypothetical protein
MENIDQGLEGVNVAKLAGIQECGNCRKWHTAQCEDREECKSLKLVTAIPTADDRIDS